MPSNTLLSRAVAANSLLYSFLLICLPALLLLPACSSQQGLKTLSGTPSGIVEAAEFSDLVTYRWLPENLSGSNQSIPADIDTAIAQAITDTLNSKGYSESLDGSADFLIGYSVTAKDRVNIHTYNVYKGYAPGFSWRPDHGFAMADMTQEEKTEAIEYREGSLVIDILDPQDNTIIWRGVGRKAIPKTFRELRIKRNVKPVVETILENFPPK